MTLTAPYHPGPEQTRTGLPGCLSACSGRSTAPWQLPAQASLRGWGRVNAAP